ncbi:DUF551 domain-containing protein [Enterobacter hormaechei]|nr:DUF551 domain-containing protein [Enterobacter hormaechei]
MSNVTKEWLQKTIAELEEERDATPGAVNEDASNALAAMKLALASLEAESVSVNDDMAYAFHHAISDSSLGSDEVEEIKAGLRAAFANVTAQPAPASVPEPIKRNDADGWWMYKGRRVGGGCAEWYNRALDDCRAAMLQGADRPQNEPQNIPENIPATQFKPVAGLYGLTSPTGGEASFTFDAVEARDFIDGGWSCQEYVELGRFQEAMLQNGNSPAQSDCCPEQNYIAPAQDGDSPVVPDGWVACSERMPETAGNYWGWWSESKRQGPVWFIKSELQAQFQSSEITHWMPLPAAPQQEVESQIRKGKTVAREEWELGARLTKHRFKP